MLNLFAVSKCILVWVTKLAGLYIYSLIVVAGHFKYALVCMFLCVQ